MADQSSGTVFGPLIPGTVVVVHPTYGSPTMGTVQLGGTVKVD